MGMERPSRMGREKRTGSDWSGICQDVPLGSSVSEISKKGGAVWKLFHPIPTRQHERDSRRNFDDHEPSGVRGRLALVNFRSDLSSFERGGALCMRVVASAAEPVVEATVLSGSGPLFCWTLSSASAQLCEGSPHIIITHGTVDPPTAPPSRAERGPRRFPEPVR